MFDCLESAPIVGNRLTNTHQSFPTFSYNGKTYFFANGRYWRFDEEEEKTEADYPRDMSVWKGIPRDLDAAFTWQADGLTYFTKKNEFYKFKNSRMRTIEEPRLIARHWFSHYCR